MAGPLCEPSSKSHSRLLDFYGIYTAFTGLLIGLMTREFAKPYKVTKLKNFNQLLPIQSAICLWYIKVICRYIISHAFIVENRKTGMC